MGDLEVVRATVCGVKNVQCVKIPQTGADGHYWWTREELDGTQAHDSKYLTDIVPLRLVDEAEMAVLDPSKDARRLRAVLIEQSGNLMDCDEAREIIHALLKHQPPLPEEPHQDSRMLDRRGTWWAKKGDLWWHGPQGFAWDRDFWEAYGPFEVYEKTGKI